MIQLKRVYDAASSTDGARFLIERLWPRGVNKTSLRMDGSKNRAKPCAPELVQPRPEEAG
jgi:uncharacterized protein YeaO (DUF488 family)